MGHRLSQNSEQSFSVCHVHGERHLQTWQVYSQDTGITLITWLNILQGSICKTLFLFSNTGTFKLLLDYRFGWLKSEVSCHLGVQIYNVYFSQLHILAKIKLVFWVTQQLIFRFLRICYKGKPMSNMVLATVRSCLLLALGNLFEAASNPVCGCTNPPATPPFLPVSRWFLPFL